MIVLEGADSIETDSENDISLTNFWNLQNVGITDDPSTDDDMEAMKQFTSTIR